MASARYLEKFENIAGTVSFTFPLNLYEWSPTQPLRVPTSRLAGTDYEYDHLQSGLAPKRLAEESVRFLVTGATGTIQDTTIAEMVSELYTIGKGKLYTIDESGTRRWAYARIDAMPSFRLSSQFSVPYSLHFKRFSDWFSTTQRRYQFDLGADTDTFKVQNNGNAKQPWVEFRLRSGANVLNASGTPVDDVMRRAGVQGDGATAPASYITAWATRTNLVTNGGFETNTTGWTTGGTNSIAVSTEQAKFGSQSLKCTYQDNDDLAFISGLTLTAVAHSGGFWLYIPSTYTGTDLRIRVTAYTSITGTTTVSANMATVDEWQWVTLPNITPDAGDLVGNFALTEGGTNGAAGEFVYLDGVQMEVGEFPSDYIETDGGTASRTIPDITTSLTGLTLTTAAPLPSGGYWIAARMRMRASDEDFEVVGGSTGKSGIFGWFGSGNEEISLFFRSGSGSYLLRFSDGTGTQDIASGQTESFEDGDDITLIAYWDDTNGGLSYNGAAFNSAALTELPASIDATVIDLLQRSGGAANSGCHWMAFGTGVPTDADATAMHALGNTDPSLDQFETLALVCERVWTADGVGAGSTYFTNPDIENQTESKSFSSTTDSTDADKELKVDTEEHSVEVSTDDGVTYADDIAAFSRGAGQAGVMSLAAGSNTFEYEDGGSPSAVLEVRFYDAWHN